MRLRAICGAALATTALVMSACGGRGGSSSSQPPSPNPTASFTRSFKSVTAEFKHGSQVIGKTILAARSMTPAQIAAAFKTLARKWQTVLSKLDSLKPPSNVATELNTLKTSASQAENDLNAVASAASTNNALAAKQAAAMLVKDIQAAKSASEKIDQKLGIT